MLRSILFFLALNALSVYLVQQLLDGFVVTGGILGTVFVGSVIGLLNVFVKPILKVLALPFVFLTLGLFVIVINALILWLAEQAVALIDVQSIHFNIDGVFTYLVAAVILGVLNFAFQKVLG